MRAPSHELRTTRRSRFWSDSRLANSVSSTSTGVPVVGVLEVDDAVAGRREVAVPDVVDDVVVAVAKGQAQAARRGRLEPVELAPARPPTTGASACSMRRRSPSTSSGARSRGLATMPRMRTAPSIDRRRRPASRSRAAARSGCAAGWRGTGAARTGTPTARSAAAARRRATASCGCRGRGSRRAPCAPGTPRRRRRRAAPRRASRRAARRRRSAGASSPPTSRVAPTAGGARRVVPFWASRSTVCSRSSALSGTVNTPAAVRPVGVDGAHVVGPSARGVNVTRKSS